MRTAANTAKWNRNSTPFVPITREFYDEPGEARLPRAENLPNRLFLSPTGYWSRFLIDKLEREKAVLKTFSFQLPPNIGIPEGDYLIFFFEVASYLWSTYSEGGARPANSYETPLVTLVRYDGNNYDPDNGEHLSLQQRAVINTIRWSGYADKLKTAEARKPQTTDDYSERKAEVTIGAIAMIEYRDEAGQLWHTFRGIDEAVMSVWRASDNALVAQGKDWLEFSCAPGVYNIHTEDWYGSVNFELPDPDIFYSERWWYAPPDISIALLSGYPGRMLILLEPAPELQFSGQQSPYTPIYEIPSSIRVGTPDNPLRHPYYRYYENGELAYYEAGEIEVWDNGTPKQVICDVANAFFNTRIYTNINPPFNNLEIYDGNTLAFEGSSWYQLTYAENPWFIETDAGRIVEKVMEKDGGVLCTVTSYFDVDVEDEEEGKIEKGRTVVFDASRRYGRFVVVPDRESMMGLLAKNYYAVNFDMHFLWYPANKGWANTRGPYCTEDAGRERPPGYDQAHEMFSARFTYTLIGNFQPVRAAAWKLTDEARVKVYENDNYEALFDDGSWAVDENVEFKAEFIPIVVIKETLENMRDNEAYRNRVRGEYPELASLDEVIIDQLVEDTGADQEPVQEFAGMGEGGFMLERHNCELFYLTARAWRSGENSVENVDDLINVPFSEDEDLWIHINLSGDGMYARVSEQTGEYFKINVLSPQRAGEISSITVKDNEGHTVYLWRSYPSFAMTTFVLGVSEGEMFATPPEEIKLAKVPGMSTRFYVELTNAWGASRTVTIGVSPYKSEFEAMFDTFLLVLFGVLVGAIFFSAGARWFRMSHRAWTPYG
jgi:hypothetical protein